MNARSHAGFWFCAALALFFCAPLMRSGEAMQAFAGRELELTRQTFGERTGAWLAGQASALFERHAPAGPLRQARIEGEGMERTRRVVPGPGTSMTLAYNRYVQGLALQLRVVCLRLFIFGAWFLVLLPVLAAAVVDGLVQRAVKRAEFGAIRPAAFSLATLVVTPMAMAPLLYLVAPVSVSPLLSPLWALLLVLPLSMLVSNSQPLFGRA